MKTILLAYRGIIYRDVHKQKVPFLIVQQLDPETKKEIGSAKEISFVNCTDAMVFDSSNELGFGDLYLTPVAHSGSYECEFFGPYVYKSVMNRHDYTLDNRIIILMNHCFEFPEEGSEVLWQIDYVSGVSGKISREFRKATKRYLTKACLAYYKDLHEIEKVINDNYMILSTTTKFTLNAGRVQEFFDTYKRNTEQCLKFTDKCINERSALMIPVSQFRVLRDTLNGQLKQFDELIQLYGKSEE